MQQRFKNLNRGLRILDLFCGGGGASVGYRRAGFDVTGVDKFLMPEYPLRFIQCDWKSYLFSHADEYDAIHASPVCKGYATVNTHAGKSKHKREIPEVREALEATGKPYVIENIPSAKLDMKSPVQLCGSSFGLRVRRHRLFESNFPIVGMPCDHAWQDRSKIYSVRGRYSELTKSGVCPVYGHQGMLYFVSGAKELYLQREAMGINWLSRSSLTQAIPPHYTHYIGNQLVSFLREEASDAAAL